MQDIYYDSIKLRNVRCHEAMEMVFPVGQFSAIVGKNGKGKSTIPKAISMALYGDDGSGKKVSDMVSKKVGKNLEIIFSFRVCDNGSEDKYEIRLYHNHSKYHSKLVLSRNGVDISGPTKTDTYRMISQIYLPMDIHNNTVYFAQQVKDFFTALTNSEQKSIFNAILSLEEWGEKYKKVDTSLSEVNEKIGPERDQLIKIDSTISEKENIVQNLLSQQVKRQIEINNLIKQLEEEILNTQKRITEIQSEKEKLNFSQSDIDDLQKKNTKLESQKSVLSSKLEQLRSSLEEKKALKCNELQLHFSSLQDKGKSEIESFFNKQISDENEKLKSVLERMTSVSKQFVCDDLEKDRKDFLEEKRKEQRFIDTEISKLDTLFSTALIQEEKTKRLRSLLEKKSEIEKKAETIRHNGESTKKDIEKLTNEVTHDTQSLNQEIATCSKCGQQLNQEHKRKVEQEISANKEMLIKLNDLLVKYRADFTATKKDHEDIIQLIKSEENQFDVSIKDREEKKNNRNVELARKKSLIDKEIQDFNWKLDLEKTDRVNRENAATKLLKDDKSAIEILIRQIRTEMLTKISDMQSKIEKDHQKSTTEQISKLVCEVNVEEQKLDQEILIVSDKIGSVIQCLRNLEDIKDRAHRYDLDIMTQKQLIEVKNDKITELNSEKFDTGLIDSQKQSISKLKEQKTSIESQIEDLIKTARILEFWKVAFSDKGIKSMLIDSAIPFMNRVCKEELEKVSDKFIVSFDTLSETKGGDIRDRFSVKVLNVENGADDHSLLSGGEKRLIDLCCMKSLRSLAENQYNKRIHVTIFDEALDALDDDNSSIFCRLMKRMSADQNVTIITHKMFQDMEADEVYKL